MDGTKYGSEKNKRKKEKNKKKTRDTKFQD